MAWYSVEVTGKNIVAEVDGSSKLLEFIIIRVVRAENEKQAMSYALSEVIQLDEYKKIVEQNQKKEPNLEVTEIELLTNSESTENESTGFIFYDPDKD